MAATDRAELTTVDLAPLIGTEVKADVETLLSGRHASQIRELLDRRGVLVFRELNLDDDQQKAFTKTLGGMALQAGKEFANVSLDRSVNKEIADYQKGSWLWHIDMMNYEVPNLASLLSARKLSDVGGETEFANTYAAWDDLPEDEKTQFDGLRVMHAIEATQFKVKPEPTLAELEQWRSIPSRVQPLVWSHRSGRKSLVVGGTALYVLDKSHEESNYILTKLREWVTQPKYVVQHRWTPGDLVIWDNTGTMHRALPYPLDSGRLMRRTVLEGEEPIG